MDSRCAAHARSFPIRDREAKALRGVAGEVRILELEGLPAKGDVLDWIEFRRREGQADAEVA